MLRTHHMSLSDLTLVIGCGLNYANGLKAPNWRCDHLQIAATKYKGPVTMPVRHISHLNGVPLSALWSTFWHLIQGPRHHKIT